jgi:hypothetical protein
MGRPTKRALKPPPRIPVAQIRTGDVNTDRAVRSLVRATEKARQDQLAKGKKVSVRIRKEPGDDLNVTVAHGLGYKPAAVRLDASRGANDFNVFRTGALDSRRATIVVNDPAATVSASLDLWIY